MPRSRRILIRVGISLASLAAVLLLLEVGLRLGGWGSRPSRYFDPDTGLRFHGNQTRNAFGRDGPQVPFTVNAEGLRGPLYRGPKPPGVTRVACLGDSFTFAWGIADEFAFPLVLEGLLAERLGPGRVQVGNYGFPMFNTEQELKAYRKLLQGRDWDVVVLGWYLNDVQPTASGARNTDNWLFHALSGTALMEFFHYRIRRHLTFGGGPGPFDAQVSPEEQRRVREYQQHYLEIEAGPDSELGRPYWDQSMADLRELVAAVRADGSQLLVVVFPSNLQVTALREGLARSPDEGAELLAGELAAPQRRVGGLLAELDVPTLDLLEPLAHSSEDPFGRLDPGHLGELGCRLTAERLRDALFELGWLPAD